MAKKVRQALGKASNVIVATVGAKITPALRKQIDTLRKPFMSYAKDFTLVQESREELAPRFMKIFGAYMQATGESFVAFVRTIDPTVPQDRDGYRAHRSYQAAEYLRRLRNQGSQQGRAKPVRSRLAVTARLLGTLASIVKDPGEFWNGIASELTLTPRQITRLRDMAKAMQPVIDVSKIKPVDVKIVHQEVSESTVTAETRESATA